MTALLGGRPDHSRSQAVLRALLYPLGLALLGLYLVAAPAQAQEDESEQEVPQPTRYQDVTWSYVSLVDFESGKEERAMELISEYAIPAYKKAGTQIPRVVELQTGPWDVMFVGALEDGPSELTWETSPEEVQFLKAHREMFGKEKTKKIEEEYESLVVRSTSFLGHSGRYGAPIPAGSSE